MSKAIAKDIDLLAGYKRSLSDRSRKKKGFRPIFLIIIAAVLFVGTFLALTVVNIFKARRFSELSAQIAELQPAYDAALEKENTVPVYYGVIDSLDTEIAITESIPFVGSEIWSAIDKCAADKYVVSSYSYNSADTVLTMEVHADTVNDVPTLVEALRQTGYFYDMEYYGYTYESDGRYFCTVGCRLVSEEVLTAETADEEAQE